MNWRKRKAVPYRITLYHRDHTDRLGIANHWTGLRGYRKPCCKVCCNDRHCSGCRNCRNCTNGPIRGNYDGLVALCAVTRESLPNQPIILSARKNISRKTEDKARDFQSE